VHFGSHFEKAPSVDEKRGYDFEHKLEVVAYGGIDLIKIKKQTWQT